MDIVKNIVICIALVTIAGCHSTRVPDLWQEQPVPTGPTIFRLEADAASAKIPAMSWDTEGGDRAKTNLLRAPVELQVQSDGTWRNSAEIPARRESAPGGETRYHLQVAPGAELVWRVHAKQGESLTMAFSGSGLQGGRVDDIRLLFPFDPCATATTVLADTWDENGRLFLPAVVSAPDLGQMLLTCDRHPRLAGTMVGDRAKQTVDFTLELPVPSEGERYEIRFEPLRLAPPPGLHDTAAWTAARRGWFNVFQISANWGKGTYGAPAGVLANNVISDPLSCAMHFWADQMFWTPEAAPDVSLAALIRNTVDYWILERTKPSGEVYAYWDHADMLDANTGPLIAAWDYVESTDDLAWLAQRIDRLEFIADYLVGRDIDDDGLIESTHSGNDHTLIDPKRADSAYDTINAGYKNAYCNALAYRALRCLADLELKLERNTRAAHYAERADKLHDAYFKTFYNPETGWLAWWRSEDGVLHDLASPMINSLAICYGLVDAERGGEILARLKAKIEAVGFTRFDLGVPITLVPVRRGEYLLGDDVFGVPLKEDGTDTFGDYLNGGCLVSDAFLFITALHIVGDGAFGDRILRAMLERQVKGVFPNGGGFQNGVVNRYPEGAEFFTWEGKTCGYEGHLTYSYTFLQALMLRDPSLRAKIYRPLAR